MRLETDTLPQINVGGYNATEGITKHVPSAP